MAGVGRGRGWLNIKNEPTRPGGRKTETTHPAPQELQSTETSQYSQILGLIQQINCDDDTILMNRKISSILRAIQNECHSEQEIKECIQHIFQLSLNDKSLSTQYAYMMCSEPIFAERKLRHFIIQQLQDYFENRNEYYSRSPKKFRNFVTILCRYFINSKFVDGKPIPIFALPVVYCLELLLDPSNSDNLEVFTINLNVTYASLKEILTDELDELLNTVRALLIKNNFEKNESRLWMLLAVDITHFKFGNLPTELYNLYKERLGEIVMLEFQGSHSALSIHTNELNSSSWEGCNSDVSILQPCIETNLVINDPEITNATSKHAYEPHKNISNEKNISVNEQNTTKHNNKNIPNDNLGIIKPWDEQNVQHSNRDKPGRPILGAGARCNNWKSEEPSKTVSPGWDNKHVKQGYHDSKKLPHSKTNKGWQHDDRFDTDYN